MTRKIVTQDAVNAACVALMKEAEEEAKLTGSNVDLDSVLTTINVRDKIGGSYSSVQKYLAIWNLEQKKVAQAAPSTPSEIESKVLEVGRTIWIAAYNEAQKTVQEIKDSTNVELEKMSKNLQAANKEILRLEEEEVIHTDVLEKQQAKQLELELALRESQTRATGQQKELIRARQELEATKKEALKSAIHAAQLQGEIDALRSQNKSNNHEKK